MFWLMLLLAVETVENGLKPKQAVKIEIVKELTLGNDEEDDNQIFSNGAQVAADADGYIFVLDPVNFRVVVFDKNGKFQHEFGNQGQGPGEFQTPGNISVDTKGMIHVMDMISKKDNIFSRDGKFVKEISFEQGIVAAIGPMSFLENGNVMLSSVKLDAQFQSAYNVSLYDAEMKPMKSYFSIPQPPTDWTQAGNPEMWVGFLKNQFEAVDKGYPLGTAFKDRILTMRSNSYDGLITDEKGDKVVQFTKAYKRKPYTEEGKRIVFEAMWDAMRVNPFLANGLTKAVFEKAYSTAEISDVLSPVNSIFSIGDHFAILSNFDPVKSEGIMEVFKANGHFIGSTTYDGPVLFMVGKGRHLYAAGNDEEDNVIVERYLLKGF